MQIKVILYSMLFILFLNGCQRNLTKQTSELKLPKKFLVINKRSLDNKQNIQAKNILQSVIDQLIDFKTLHNIQRTIEYNDSTMTVTYIKDSNTIASFNFMIKIQTSKNAHTLTFYNFKKQFSRVSNKLLKSIDSNFYDFYRHLDKVHFTKKKVYIFVNNFPSLLDKTSLHQKLSQHYKAYKPKKYTNIYMIAFDKKAIPVYIDLRESSLVHVRSYIPYAMNTKSGTSLSSYKLELFKHKLKNIVSK